MSAISTGNNHTLTQNFIIQIAGLFLIIPLSPFICRFIPPVLISGYNIDLIISIIIAVLFVRLITWLVRPMVIPLLLLVVVILTINQFTSAYSFKNVFNDYQNLVAQNWTTREQKAADLLSTAPYLFEDGASKTSRLVKEKVQYNDSVVRNFSVKHSLENFKTYENKYGMLTRYFSLFKYINHNFNYVPDSQKDEYYATPRETILNGIGGDCDDHSILMASCLMSIGAQCRLVIVDNHMYPEMYVGNKKDFDLIQEAILQMFSDERIDRIYYHENNGQYWVNLDYTAHHPGGPYLNDNVKLLIDL